MLPITFLFCIISSYCIHHSSLRELTFRGSIPQKAPGWAKPKHSEVGYQAGVAACTRWGKL